MPVFEYRCEKCNTRFEILHKSTVNQEKAVCPGCHSSNVKKLISSFSTTGGNSENEYCSPGNCRLNDDSGGCESGMCGMG